MTVATKYCPRCETTHPTACFYKHQRTKDGLQAWCRSCMNEASKHSQGKKREENREMKELLKKTDIGYRIAMKELREKFQKVADSLAVIYHKDKVKVQFDFEFKGEANGQIERKAAEGPTEFGVRSTQP